MEQQVSARRRPARIVSVIETGADAEIVEELVSRTLTFCDAVLAVQHPSADNTRDLLVGLIRRGLPVVVFDSPRASTLSWLERFDFSRNARRFFDPDVLVLLGRRALLACGSREEFEREVAPTPGSHEKSQSASRASAAAATISPGGTRGSIQWLTVPDLRASGRLLLRTDLQWLDGLSVRGGERNSTSLTLFHRAAVAWVPRLRTSFSSLQRLGRRVRRRAAALVTRMRGAMRNESSRISLPGNLTCSFVPIAHAGGERTWTSAGSGVLDARYHRDNFYLDCPPFRYVADKYAPASVLDLGCGLGAYVRMFQAWGARDTVGVDGLDVTLCEDSYLQHDLRQPLFLNRKFDLVICAEVVEHIEPDSAAGVVATVLRHAGSLILFSAAAPGQPGSGHVNCRPIEEWIESFRQAGWEPDPFDTIAIRSLATFFWFRRNLLLLKPRGENRSRAFSLSDLTSYEAKAVRWIDQRPAVHAFPLQEPPARISRVPGASRVSPPPTESDRT